MVTSQESLVRYGLNIESVTWGDLTWTNIVSPSEKEIGYLADNYHFHPMDLEDCLSRRQRPKLDIYKDYLFFIFQFSVWNKVTRVSKHDQVSVFIGDKYLITVHNGQLKTLVKLFRECQIDEEARREYFSYGSGYLIYHILDRTIDAYFPILNSILAWVDDIEDTVFDENVSAVKELAALRRDIVTQRRILHAAQPVYIELEKRIHSFTKKDLTVQFGDLMDHLNRAYEALDEAKDVIEIFKDTDYHLSTERLNSIMRVLTILGSIVLPFIMVSSIYGMNIPLPGGLERGSLQSFIVLAAIMVVVSGVMIYVFHRRRWI